MTYSFSVGKAFDAGSMASVMSFVEAGSSVLADTDNDGRIVEGVGHKLSPREELQRRYNRIINDVPSKFREQALVAWHEEKLLLESTERVFEVTRAKGDTRHKKYRLSHLSCKLTPEKIIEICVAYEKGGQTQRTIAKKFGVSQTIVGRILRGEAWK